MPIGLHAFEYLLAVVKNRGGGIERNGPIRLNTRSVPSALLGPTNIDHVVSKDSAENRFGESFLQGFSRCRVEPTRNTETTQLMTATRTVVGYRYVHVIQFRASGQSCASA